MAGLVQAWMMSCLDLVVVAVSVVADTLKTCTNQP
jgi:hypothetical protein